MENIGNIVYFLGKSMYLNITNRCPNSCNFCIRDKTDTIDNRNLWLDREPELDEIIESIGDPGRYKEVVFCGYGEPLVRLDTVIEVCKYLRRFKVPVRIDTNGLANLIHNENIVPKLESLVDYISVSLNAESAKKYDEFCHSKYGLDAFPAVLEFARLCRDYIPNVTLTIVDVPDVNLAACKKIAKSLGVNLRVRSFLPNGYWWIH